MKRLRVFAGPNGSGKTTMVKEVIAQGREKYGRDLIDPNRHINPDVLNSIDIIDFDEYGLTVDESNFRDYLLQSPFYKDCNFNIKDIILINNCFVMPTKSSYIGSMLADYLRDCYVKSEERLFSFETVFSHSSKVDFLETANAAGWQVYLYFVTTLDPCINCDRVDDRVLKGGHDVPHEKIIDRYKRALDNLYPALKHCKKAYLFDNSKEMNLVAKKYEDGTLKLCGNFKPLWFYEHVASKCQLFI